MRRSRAARVSAQQDPQACVDRGAAVQPSLGAQGADDAGPGVLRVAWDDLASMGLRVEHVDGGAGQLGPVVLEDQRDEGDEIVVRADLLEQCGPLGIGGLAVVLDQLGDQPADVRGRPGAAGSEPDAQAFDHVPVTVPHVGLVLAGGQLVEEVRQPRRVPVDEHVDDRQVARRSPLPPAHQVGRGGRGSRRAAEDGEAERAVAVHVRPQASRLPQVGAQGLELRSQGPAGRLVEAAQQVADPVGVSGQARCCQVVDGARTHGVRSVAAPVSAPSVVAAAGSPAATIWVASTCLHGPLLPRVLRPPRAGAARRCRRRPAGRGARGRPPHDRPTRRRRACTAPAATSARASTQPRVERARAAGVVGQLAVEVRRLGDVVARPGRPCRAGRSAAPHPVGARARSARPARRPRRVVPGQQRADQVGVVGGVVRGERVQHAALAGEAAGAPGRA